MSAARHLLDLDDADRPPIEALLTRAKQFQTGVPNEGIRLRGKIVVGMFFEPSTRTTMSYAVAATRLGATWLDLRAKDSSMTKGESLEDTMRTLHAIGADAIVVRHPQAGFPHVLAEHFPGVVHNAGDGAHAHPTQGLADAMTLVEEFGDLTGRKLIIAGDIRHSRVARSSAKACWLLGASVTLCGPPLLLPPTTPGWGFAELCADFDSVLPHADALMLLRIQKERVSPDEMPPYEDLKDAYGLSSERAAMLSPHCVVLHPGPVNRDVELDSAVMRSAASRIERQVHNGVYIRMAALERSFAAANRERAA